MIKITEAISITKRDVVIASAAVICSIFLILFTPFRYTILVEPTINDVAPQIVFNKIKDNPSNYLFIDVRQPSEYANAHAEGSINIPIQQLFSKWKDLPREGKEIVLICTGGSLSGVAFYFLQHFGFTNISRVEGGLQNWLANNLPIVLPT